MKAHPTAAAQQSMMHILGGMLARLHTISSQWRAPAGFQRPHLDRDGLLGPHPHWGRFWDHPVLSAADRALILSARARLLDRLGDLDESADIYGVVHADLHGDNIITQGSSLAIIDFDDAAYGWYHYDIATTLESYVTRLS
jgi:Ser/Thr protein kinase RdoA (MazF antagonist)